MKAKAKVFQSGYSPVIRLPKSFRLRSKAAGVERVPNGLLITEDDALARRAAEFASLAGFPAFAVESVVECSALRRVP